MISRARPMKPELKVVASSPPPETAAPAAPDGPLTYRFDSGFGGWEYVIEFRDGRVSAVRERGLD